MANLEMKRYIGDGVYVVHDGFHLVLTSSDGYRINTIYLEPSVWAALKEYGELVYRDAVELHSDEEEEDL